MITQTTKSGSGAAGQSERKASEELDVLSGARGSGDDRAVRLGELRGLVAGIVADMAANASSGETSVSPSRGQIADFREVERQAGFYLWQIASRFLRPNTLNPPPEGSGGGAIFLERGEGVGTWIAGLADGSLGSYEPRLFTMGTSGQPDDYGAWFEVFTQYSAIAEILMISGRPAGGLLNVVSNSNGVAIQIATGHQLCYKLNLTASRANDDRMDASWTYPVPFVSTPLLIGSVPASGYGTYTGISALDAGTVAVEPDLATGAILIRRDNGAPNFPIGSSITNVGGLAIGRFL